jgi:CrcB protein
MAMKALVYVAVGGALGSLARYGMAGASQNWAALHWGMRFPIGTLGVNWLGCVLIGVVAGLADKHGLLGADARLFLVTGVLGGFTTFSAFGLETMLLLRSADYGLALGYVLTSVLGGVALVALGWWLLGPAR